MHIIQHIPNFVDGVEPKTAEFTDRESFDQIDWIKYWAATVPEHDHFEISWSHREPYILSVSADHEWWWVVGRVTDPTDGLKTMFPKWEHPDE